MCVCEYGTHECAPLGRKNKNWSVINDWKPKTHEKQTKKAKWKRPHSLINYSNDTPYIIEKLYQKLALKNPLDPAPRWHSI